ncbi:uncharacterized protein [Garra rufa]|uniref:uncharacterized protein n=1 Tax=Garra rufa TaxID=137080 RepID=UPI003CCE8E3E
MSTQKRAEQLKADISSTISVNGKDQGSMDNSSTTNEKTCPKGPKPKPEVDLVDADQLCVPAPNRLQPELQVDLVDEEQLCIPGPSGPEHQVTTNSTQKRDVQLKADISSTISVNGQDQGSMNSSSATNEKTCPKVGKSNKTCAFFQRPWKASKKYFQKNRVEAIGISAQPDPEPPCVPGPKPKSEVDLVDADQLCVPAPNRLQPELQVDLVDEEQLCIPGPSGPEHQVTTKSTQKRDVQLKADIISTISENENDQSGMTTETTGPKGPSAPEPQVTTELSALNDHLTTLNIFRLERRMCKCRVQWTPVTEVWPNVFIGNEETAMDRIKLREMGITHILNTVAYKEYLEGKIDIRADYYIEMNITYNGVLVMDKHRFDISKDLFPASEFIHKALSNTENKLLVHCIDGVSRSATFVLAYLMIHHEMLLEDAIDHVIDKRWVRPSRNFLRQLIALNSNLITQRKQQMENKEDPEAQLVPELWCEPGPSRPKPEPQVRKELLVLENHVPQSVLQLRDRLDECILDWTPVTEVWPKIYIGNEETARNRAKLKGMGINHILNAAKSLKGKVNTGVTYYQGRNINYYEVPAVDKCSFNISDYFFPAAQFIHQALSNPKNKVLVHCKMGISRSATLVLAYLMIHHNMMVEDAIDHVLEVKWIRPNTGFLKQLTILNSDLKSRRLLQLKQEYS